MAKSKEIQHQTAHIPLRFPLLTFHSKAVHAHTYKLESNLIESSNDGSFYRYVNKKPSSRSGVGCLKFADGSITNDPREKSEL